MKPSVRRRIAVALASLVLIAAGCSSSAKRAAPIGADLSTASDADVLKHAVTAGLAGVPGVDQACIQRELASIPADFKIPVDSQSAATDDTTEATAAEATAAEATAAEATAAETTAAASTIADPLDVLGNSDCGGDSDTMLKQMAATPAGEELLVRVLAAGFAARGLPVELVCVRTVISSTTSNVVDALLTSADSPPDDITKRLSACTK